MTRTFLPLLLLVVAWLQGCATVDMREQYAGLSDAKALEKTYYDVEIPMRDGARLRATVYQPALKPGETAPVLITAHGFGGFRTSGPISVYGLFVITGEATLQAWEHGYWVISYDQRGFGQSDGNIEMMDPDWEPRDLMEVVTWADRHLPRLSRESPGDPLVGTLGESWGGGVQLLAGFHDPRIDAMVPITTWNNLADAFAPNDFVRSYWGLVLFSVGTFSSGFDFGKSMEGPYRRMFAGEMDAEGRALMEVASPSGYCAQGKPPLADMLLLQGFEDTVMIMNQAVANQQCALQAGRDARLVALQSGHRLLWPVQSLNGFPMFHTDDAVDCGDGTRFETLPMVQQWLDLKLKGIPEPTPIPRVCLTLPDEQPGFSPEAMPVGGTALQVKDAHAKLVQSGWFDVVVDPVEHFVSLAIPASDSVRLEDESDRGGWLRPYFLPLWVARERTAIVGIPTMDLEVSNTWDDEKDVVFAGVGVRRNGSIAIDVVSDQYTPLVGAGRHVQPMPGVSGILEKGDTVGLVLQGFTGQWFFNPEGWTSTAHVNGRLDLPLRPAPARRPD